MIKPKLFKPNHGGIGKKFDGLKKWEDMYDAVWAKYRQKFLYNNPNCYCCGSIASVVDHITPAKGDEKLFKKLDNHLPLCSVCHNTITAKFDRNYKQGDAITPKLKWIEGVRSRNQITIRVRVLGSYE
jgi:5-methylcytosine-specific restriction endonuclease McrA